VLFRSDLYQGRLTFNVEPAGKYRYPMNTQLDLRLEKTFTLAGKYRLGLVFDIFNVFNADTLTSWGGTVNYNWYPGVTDPTDPDFYASTQNHYLYGLTLPRRARLGIRFIF
jgi:hypothetical protein